MARTLCGLSALVAVAGIFQPDADFAVADTCANASKSTSFWVNSRGDRCCRRQRRALGADQLSSADQITFKGSRMPCERLGLPE
jgi:hypothetical protein